jgi:hypothetical protein
MAGRADAIKDAMQNSVDDLAPALRPVGGVPRNMKGRQGTNRDGVENVDHFDDKPDAPDVSNPRRPTEAGGESDSNAGTGRNDGRDERGRFVGDGNRPWADREQVGLDRVADREGVDVIRDQVRATIPGVRKPGASTDQPRYYDGLFKNPDGTYTGVEVKSGTATRDPAQRLFDGTVSRDRPAGAILDGERIEIIQVILEKVE